MRLPPSLATMDAAPRDVPTSGDGAHPPRWSDWFLLPAAGSGRRMGRAARWLNFVLAAAVVATLVGAPFLFLDAPWKWSAVWRYRQKFLDGYRLTILLSAGALALSLVFGALSALAGRSPVLVLRLVNRVYIDLVRGTPLLVQILVLFYVTANAVGIDDRNVCGVLILAFSYGAYLSEILRAGIESVGTSQLDSARAIGLTPAQTYRYVIFPQALRQILPSLAGQLVSLVKDSALLSTISVAEFTQQARETGTNTASELDCYLVLAGGYLVLTLPVAALTRRLEARARFDT